MKRTDRQIRWEYLGKRGVVMFAIKGLGGLIENKFATEDVKAQCQIVLVELQKLFNLMRTGK